MKSEPRAPAIIGILNVTADSFSDGGRYLDPRAAVEKGLGLAAEGADIVEVGGESSNPDGARMDAAEELARIEPVILGLKKERIRISVDTRKPVVMRRALALGADMINDVTGLGDAEAVEAVRGAGVPVVVMFARNRGPRAERASRSEETVLAEIEAFFAERLASLESAGIAHDRIIIDPGMGFFLGGTPGPSLTVLRELEALRRFGCPLCVSTSRKSFIGAVLNRPVGERGAGTLATEIWAWLHGAGYIRTHEPGPLRDAARMILAIRGPECPWCGGISPLFPSPLEGEGRGGG